MRKKNEAYLRVELRGSIFRAVPVERRKGHYWQRFVNGSWKTITTPSLKLEVEKTFLEQFHKDSIEEEFSPLKDKYNLIIEKLKEI